MGEINGVEIFGVGTWNKFKFVLDDLKEIIKNTNSLVDMGEHNPPIKLGHSTNQILKGQDDGDPSLGTPTNFRIKLDKIVADFKNIPDILMKAIEKKRFNSVSVEMDHIKHKGWFIKAVSLLGADLPAVKTIKDLQMFMTDDLTNSSGDIIQLAFSEPSIIGDSKMSDEQKTPAETQKVTVNLTQDEQLKKELAEMKAKFADIESEKVASQKKLAEFEAEKIERSFSEQKSAFVAEFKKDSSDGKLKPALVKEIENYLDEQRATFTENSTLGLNADLMSKVKVAYSEGLPKGESGSDEEHTKDGLYPDERIELEIAKVRSSTGMNYDDADEAVAATHPGLWKDYCDYTNNVSEGRA